LEVGQLKNFFNEKGFDDISLIPVMTDRHNPLRLDKGEIKDLGRFYLDQSKELVKGLRCDKPTRILEDIPIYLERLKSGIKSKRFCGAGHSLMVVTPNGDFFPCPSLVSNAEFRMGSMRDGISEAIIERFYRNTVENKAACKACWARNLCGGGCAALAWDMNKNIEVPDAATCETLKAKIMGAIYIHDQLTSTR
jgi:uncharacterized protein